MRRWKALGEAVRYWIGQLVGAIVAAALLLAVVSARKGGYDAGTVGAALAALLHRWRFAEGQVVEPAESAVAAERPATAT